MDKSELIDAVTDRLAVDRKTVTSAVDVLLETVTRAVAKGERVVLTGFGSFEKKDKPARTGRNPATGAAIKLKKTSVPRVQGRRRLQRRGQRRQEAAEATTRYETCGGNGPDHRPCRERFGGRRGRCHGGCSIRRPPGDDRDPTAGHLLYEVGADGDRCGQPGPGATRRHGDGTTARNRAPSKTAAAKTAASGPAATRTAGRTAAATTSTGRTAARKAPAKKS